MNKKYNEIDANELNNWLINNEKIYLIDVREPEEFNEENIESSINLPLGDIPKKITKLVMDKNAKIVVYCHSGHRSVTASNYLIKKGYKNLYNLTGGILEWMDYKLQSSNI